MTLRQGGWRFGTVLVGVVVGLLVLCASAFAEEKTVTLEPGGQTTFEVPAGVDFVKVEAYGGRGEDGHECHGNAPGGAGGLGAKVTATLQVSYAHELSAKFGGGGKGGVGANETCLAGGNGGGRAELSSDFPNVLIVAGGGGGGGGNSGSPNGGSAEAGSLHGGAGSGTYFNPEGGGKGGQPNSPGLGGKGQEYPIACPEGGSPGSGVTGGAGEDDGSECNDGGGGGGGGYFGGGGGAGGVEQGSGGGAGSSYVEGEVEQGPSEVSVNEATATEKIVITYSVPAPPLECSMASGHGTVEKQGQPGHLGLSDDLSTNLSAPQRLVVNYEHNKPRYHLVQLTRASCAGAPGEQTFSGAGTAVRNTKKGYTLQFSLSERAGGFYFESKVMKGAEVVEANGGPLKTKTQKID